jgi:glycerate kinase
MVTQLDAALSQYGQILEKTLSKTIFTVPGSGAAGGLGAALFAILNAKLRPGIDIVLDAIHFREQLSDADLVITGEGKLDAQTRSGKAIHGITQEAHRAGVPVLALAGALFDGADDVVDAGFCWSFLRFCDEVMESLM